MDVEESAEGFDELTSLTQPIFPLIEPNSTTTSGILPETETILQCVLFLYD